MKSLLFLILAAGVMVLWSLQHNSKLHEVLSKHSVKSEKLPQALGMLIICAQISELLKVIEHVSLVNVVAALFLLAIVAATKTGTEGGLH